MKPLTKSFYFLYDLRIEKAQMYYVSLHLGIFITGNHLDHM